MRALVDKLTAGHDHSFFRGKRIVVTGASGLIGGGLAEYFASLPGEWRVSTVGQTRDRRRMEWRLGARPFSGEWRIHEGPLEGTLELAATADLVVHCASPASPKDYMLQPAATIEANVGWISRLLPRLRRGATLLYVSSADVYGDAEVIPTPEDYPGKVDVGSPRSVYAEAKRVTESLLAAAVAQDAQDVRVVRPFNVYGQGQRLDDGRLVADFVRCGLERKAIELRSDGSPLRSFCHLDDLVEGTVLALLYGKPGRPYNLGNDWDERSIRDLAAAATRIFELPPPVFGPAPDYQRGSLSRCRPDLARARGELKFVPQVSFEEGLGRTWKWIKSRK